MFRSGDIIFNFENGSIVIGAQAATQRLYGEFKWQLDFRVVSPQGKMSLEIDGLDVKLGLKQPINIQKKPKLEVLKVSLGNIQVIRALAELRGPDTPVLFQGTLIWNWVGRLPD